MNRFKFLKHNKRQIFIIAILVAGLLVLLILFQTKQILRPKARISLQPAFGITDTNGSMDCTDLDYQISCQTNQKKVHIRFNQDYLEQIKDFLP